MVTRRQLSAQPPGESSEVPPANQRVRVDGPQTRGWLVLVYRIQPQPTRLRAAVWRRLKTLGAIYLHAGTAVAPYDVASEHALRTLHQEIRDMSGTSILLRCNTLVGETAVINAFNAARTDEYNEIMEKSRDLLRRIERKPSVKHFTSAELQDSKISLRKLQEKLSRVQVRDVFRIAERQAAEQLIAECWQALASYADHVHQLDQL